jgi:hypothetical protein
MEICELRHLDGVITNFTCQVCFRNIKENKTLRLEVHHSTKAFNTIFKENNITTTASMQ